MGKKKKQHKAKQLKIVLVRHGYSLGNKRRSLSGWTDVPLIQEGIDELEKYHQLYDYPETDSYFVSPLVRAKQTAAILYPGKDFIQMPAFKEINFGRYEEMTNQEIDFKTFFDGWLTEEPIDGGENYSQFKERVLTAFGNLNQDLVKQGVDSYTLVSHSGVMKAIYIHCAKLDYRDFFEINMQNGLGYVLELRVDGQKQKCHQVSPLHKKPGVL